MSSQAEKAPNPAPRGSKRSETVTLVLLAGAGAAAWGFARIDPSQREEDVLVYNGPEACISAAIRTSEDCRRDYATVRLAYPNAAPRYATASDCESHHGPGHCVTGDSVGASATGRFVPVLAGYIIGRTEEQDLDPQPIYDHRPSEAGPGYVGSGSGGYCTSWGGRVSTTSGGSSSFARVASSAVRPASFGGFGATGRGFSSHGGSAHGSGG
ncbi:DUF1190 domain-containing protein [Methylobacterium sp. BTF04]|uniref:DUF1190 domain-containing protein n=1 Tax=Methylobacterium sp. BTF04 TaxID=2708300 RepID=UPI0013D0EE0F|nr:DUF1190 domain-containing protein [Methylobacterium sp. BTF04]NEU13907.1 DUF1190 domain-containing protein [Methylobacterium sp. BTF04]